ncbi:MAG: three-helix bundle dimerization domain-containing protein [Marmoricola sp.]
MNAPGIEQQISTIVEDLSKEFSATHSREQVRSVVARWRQDIEPSAKIQDFIGVLVRRFAREEIEAGLKPDRIAV